MPDDAIHHVDARTGCPAAGTMLAEPGGQIKRHKFVQEDEEREREDDVRPHRP